MKQEKKFQNAIINAFELKKFYVLAGVLTPGHPDITTFRHGESCLVELKDITDISLSSHARDIFQRAQLPWMMKFQRQDRGATFIAIADEKKYYVYIVDSMPAVIFLKEKNLEEVLKRSIQFCSLNKMVNYIIGDYI